MDESRNSKPKDSKFHFISRLKPVPGIGILFATLSGILFAISTSMVKYLNEINPFEILFFRSAVQMFIYLPLILYKRDNIKGSRDERLWMLLDNLIGFTFLALGYVAIRLISLGDSSAIIFSSSVYASIFARFILAEPCNIISILCILIVISGVFLISRPSFIFGTTHYSYSSFDRTLGLVLSLASSLSAALYYVLLKKIRKTSTTVAMFWFSSTGAMGTLILLLIQGQFTVALTVKECIILVANGFVGSCGLFLLGFALKLEDAGPVSLARTIDIVGAFIIQIAAFHDPAPWTSILGSVIIIFGVAVSVMRNYILNKLKSLAKRSTSNEQNSMQLETVSSSQPISTISS